MPDWTYSTTSRINWDSDFAFYVTIPNITTVPMQQDNGYEEYRQECERQDRMYELQMQMYEQQMEEERQKQEDRRKYPLFFLKEGIV